MASQMERKPRAPNLYSIALSTIKSSASLVNVSLTPSIASKCSYCLISAFLGSVKICRKAFLSSGIKYVKTGNRPISSGISPYAFKSCGAIYCSKLFLSIFSFSLLALNPTMVVLSRCAIFFSIPSNAPHI